MGHGFTENEVYVQYLPSLCVPIVKNINTFLKNRVFVCECDGFTLPLRIWKI